MSRGFRTLQVLVICSLLLLLFVPIQSQQTAQYANDRVIVKLKPGIQSADIDAIRTSLDASVLKHLKLIGAELWKISGVSVDDAIARYRSDPRVLYIEPDYIVHALEVIPNDPSFGLLWGMHNTGQTGGTPDADIDAPEAWEITTGNNVVLGVIDTGVDWSHADLANNIWSNPGETAGNGLDDDGNGYIDDVRGWDFVNNDNDPMDDNGHGTHVSGTIAASGNNGIGVVGVSWSAKIMPLKFLDYSGGGYTSNAVLAVEYATMMGARFTNNSWGGGGYSSALYDAIAAAGSAGMLFVAAAGNSGENNDITPHYPSSYDLDNIISVAATDHNDNLAGFSCYGAVSVDLAAPGVDIYSCLPGGTYGYNSGTSMSTPHVSGAVSLFWSQYPSTPHLSVKERMLASVDVIPSLAGMVLTGGRLNVAKMVAEPDTLPPDAITDLAAVNPTSNAMTLTWTATGDDSSSGTAAAYDIRYSPSPIDEGNFDLANQAQNEPLPQPAGSAETFTISGLDFSTTYYFAVKALDEWGNPSPVSNSPSGTTLGVPHIAVSPDEMSADLMTGETSVQNLTIENTEPNTTLDFCISITAAEDLAARVDVIGDRSLRSGIIARGKPLSAKELGSLRTSFPERMTIGSTGAVDRGAPARKNPTVAGALERIDGEEVFGSTQNQYFAGPRSRGNIFACTTPTTLLEHRLYINPSIETQLWFLVYEGESQVGTYNLVSASNVSPAGPGEGWYSSGDINVPLVAGRYYLIFASFEQESNYYNEQGIAPYPIPASFGALIGAAGYDWAPTSNFPPDPTQSVPDVAFGASVAYYQTIVTGVGTSWLSVAPECGTVSGSSSTDVEVTFNAAGLDGGDYEASIVVASNDVNHAEVIVPATLHVTGAPDITVSPLTLNYGSLFLGATKPDTLEIANDGTDILSVTAMSLDNPDFTADLAPFDLGPHEKRDLIITFAPSSVGSKVGTLTITSNDFDEGTVEVALQGEGVLPPEMVCPSVDELSRNLFTNETWDTVLTLCNDGESELSYCIATEEPDVSTSGGTAARVSVGAKVRSLSPLGASSLVSQPKPVNGPPRPLRESETAGNRSDHAFAASRKTPEATASVIFEDDFEDGNYDGWLDAGGSGIKEVTSATAAKGTYSYHEYLSPYGHFDGVYHEFGAIQPGYVGFYIRSGSTGTNDAYFVLRDSQAFEVIWFFAEDNGFFYVNNDVGGDNTYPYQAGTWYHVEFKDIDFLSKTFDYYVDNTLIKADIPFRNAGDVNDFYRVDLYNYTYASEAWWDEIVLATEEPTSWLSTSPECGTVPPNSCVDIMVTFNATGMYGGDYYADLVIAGNDPVNPECRIPAHLHVTGVCDIAVVPVAINYEQLFVGATKVDTLVISNEGTDVLQVTDMTLSNADFSADLTPFDLAPEESRLLAVGFTPSVEGLIQGYLTITSNDPDEATIDVGLEGIGLPPPIMICPPTDTLYADLRTDETWDTDIKLCNEGQGALEYSMRSEEATGPTRMSAEDAVASIIARSGVLKGPIKMSSAKAFSPGEPVERVFTTAAEIANVKVGPAALPSVALVAADLAEWVPDIQGKLEATGLVGSVAFINAAVVTPTLIELQAFDAVMVWSNYSFSDAAALGNNLADYVDNGGGVVCAMFELAPDWCLGGRWQSEQYYLIERSDVQFYNAVTLGAIAEPAHPIMAGVSSFDGGPASYHPSTTVLTEGSTLIASWSDGIPLVVARDEGGARRADLCFYPVSSDVISDFWQSGTDGDLLMANAVTWVAAGSSWLSADPAQGSVAPEACLDVTVTLDATGMYGGDYYANLVVHGDDPLNPECQVPAHLHVTGIPDIAVSPTALDYGLVFIGGSKLDSVMISNSGTDALNVTGLTMDNPAFTVDPTPFDVAPGESRHVMVTFAPSAAQLEQGTLTITSNDPDEGSFAVQLQGEGVPPPEMVCPPADTLSRDLFTGAAWDTVLTLCNTGESDLTFSILGEEAVEPDRMTVDEAVASIVARSGVLEGEIRVSSVARMSSTGEPVERVCRSPRDVANVKYGPTAGPSVALVAADDSSWIPDVRDKLLATGLVGSVTVIQASAVTPTLAELRAFDAIMVWSDYSYSDNVTLGNNLADYVDGGGNVVSMMFEVASYSYSNPYNLGGRWQSGQYYLVERSNQQQSPSTLGTVAQPSHPIMAHVSSFDGGMYSPRPSTTALTSGATLVASWSDGMPLVVVKETAEARRVDLCFFPVSSDAMDGLWVVGTDGDRLMANALAWVTGSVPWLSAVPDQGTIPPGSCTDVTVTLDATDMYGGDYYGNLAIRSNDPIHPECRVPAHLRVTGAADIAVEPPSIDYGQIYLGTTKADTLVISNGGTDVLSISEMALDNADFSADLTPFDLSPTESRDLVVTFAPSAAGTVQGTLTITSNDPDEGVLGVSLAGEGMEPPVISVAPDSLVDSLLTGETSTQLLTISNTGQGQLDFTITTAPMHGAFASAASVSPLARRWGEEHRSAPVHAKAAASTSELVSSAADHERRAVPPINTIAAVGDSSILIIQDGSAWGIDMFTFIFEQFGLVSTVINSSQIASADFTPFQVVLTTGDQGYDYYNAITANVAKFESYVAGGGVVQYQLATQGPNVGIVAGVNVIFDHMENYNNVVTPSHPIVAGLPPVLEGTAANHTYLANLPAGAVIITETSSSGDPTTVEYAYGGGTVVATGMTWEFLYNYGFTAGAMLRNAVAYSLSLAGVQWLSVDPSAGAVPPMSSVDVEVQFNAAGLNGGDYHANVVVASNDPINPEVTVPAHLHVTGAPDIAVVPVAINYEQLLVGATKVDTLVISNQGTDVLHVTDMALSNADFSADLTPFDLAPMESRLLEVAFTPSVEGLIQGYLTITSNDPDEATIDVGLEGIGLPAPVISVSPDSFVDSLLVGQTSTHTMTIANTGGSDLNFTVRVDEGLLVQSLANRGSGGAVSPAASPAAPPVVIGKGQKDTRTYPRMDRASGGPDGFGYRWRDSNEPGGPVFDWIDVSGGSTISLGDDDFRTAIPLFKFMYYGQEFTSIGVGSNGWLSFNGSNYWYPSGVPQVDEYVGAIAPFARDLDPPSGNYIHYQTIGMAPHRRFVVEYNQIPNCCSGEFPKTFEVIFYEGSNAIRFQYLTAGDDPYGFGIESPDQTMGMGNAGMDDLFISPALVEDNYAIEFAAPPRWLWVDSIAGTVPAGESVDLVVTMDATALAGGNYDADIVVASNDPATPEYHCPAHLAVLSEGTGTVVLGGCPNGWYLKSWNVDTPVDSTATLLGDIAGCLTVALGFDGGGQSYYPSIPPQFNTLKTMDHLHGYWFRMACDDTLQLDGELVSPQTPIPLDAGWNVVSYLPAMEDSTAHALGGIMNHVSVVLGFECGGLSYYPSIPPEFNTLQTMKPGCGYWIKMGTAGTLIYPETAVYEAPVTTAAMMPRGEGYRSSGASRVVPTREWINVWGQGLRFDGFLLPVGTVVKAVDEEGVVCGQCVVRTAGNFGLMAIYRDDPETVVDEGARAGDEVTLYIGDVKVSGGVRWNEMGDLVNVTEALSLTNGNVETPPAQYALLQNYPNPFNPTTAIRYALPKDSYVELVIYSVQGQVVRELVKGAQRAQRYVVEWDGKNDQGQSVASGIYFYRIKAGDFVNTKKMVLLR